MDERTRQGAERFHYAQAAGRATEQADAWGRAAGQAGQATSQATGQAAQAADAARSTLPSGIRSG